METLPQGDSSQQRLREMGIYVWEEGTTTPGSSARQRRSGDEAVRSGRESGLCKIAVGSAVVSVIGAVVSMASAIAALWAVARPSP